MIVGCFVLDLYCRNVIPQDGSDSKKKCQNKNNFNHGPFCFIGETRGEAVKAARSIGWVLGRDGDATCPFCSGKAAK